MSLGVSVAASRSAVGVGHKPVAPQRPPIAVGLLSFAKLSLRPGHSPLLRSGGWAERSAPGNTFSKTTVTASVGVPIRYPTSGRFGDLIPNIRPAALTAEFLAF